MNCDAVKKAIPLYHYGELLPDTEEGVEEHVDACAECREALELQRKMAAALDRHELTPPADLLAECRHELVRAIYREETPALRRSASDPWGLFREAFKSMWRPGIRFRQPAGAVALLALGFFAARFAGPWVGNATLAGFSPDAIVSSVRSVQPDSSGRVQIAVDET